MQCITILIKEDFCKSLKNPEILVCAKTCQPIFAKQAVNHIESSSQWLSNKFLVGNWKIYFSKKNLNLRNEWSLDKRRDDDDNVLFFVKWNESNFSFLQTFRFLLWIERKKESVSKILFKLFVNFKLAFNC